MDESERNGGGTAQRLTRLARAARRAKDASADADAARDQAIADAEEQFSYGEIAKLTELSKGHVHRICVEQASNRQEQPEND